MKPLYQCEICESVYKSEQEAVDCEQQKIPEIPIGLIWQMEGMVLRTAVDKTPRILTVCVIGRSTYKHDLRVVNKGIKGRPFFTDEKNDYTFIDTCSKEYAQIYYDVLSQGIKPTVYQARDGVKYLVDAPHPVIFSMKYI